MLITVGFFCKPNQGDMLAYRHLCMIAQRVNAICLKTVLPLGSLSMQSVTSFRYIRSINRQNLPYKLAPNHLVDLTDEEYDGHAGKK